MRKIRSKEILKDAELAEVGSIALESTYCEILLEQLIWSLAGLNEDNGKFFTHSLQVKSRIELLSSIGKKLLSTQADIDEFTDILSEIKRNNNDRNLVVHGYWGAWISLKDLAKLDEGKSFAKAIKRRLNSASEEFKATDLDKIASNISRSAERLRQFAMKKWPNLP